MINLLFLGEIVGRAGIQALKNGLGDLKKHYQVDYTMINAEGMTNGYGIGKMHSQQISLIGLTKFPSHILSLSSACTFPAHSPSAIRAAVSVFLITIFPPA